MILLVLNVTPGVSMVSEKFSHQVSVLCYHVGADRWSRLKLPATTHALDGLESLVHHAGALYFLLSKQVRLGTHSQRRSNQRRAAPSCCGVAPLGLYGGCYCVAPTALGVQWGTAELTSQPHHMHQRTRTSQCTKMGIMYIYGCVHTEVHVCNYNHRWVPTPKDTLSHGAECCKSCA